MGRLVNQSVSQSVSQLLDIINAQLTAKIVDETAQNGKNERLYFNQTTQDNVKIFKEFALRPVSYTHLTLPTS